MDNAPESNTQKTTDSIPSLWAHQAEGIRRALELNNFAFFWSMGTGKTRVAIEVLRKRYNEEKRILRTLILAPPIVVPNWRNEFLKYSKTPASQIRLLQGPQPKRISEASKGNILVTNYEALLMPNLFDFLMTWKPEIIVADESHRFKNHSAKRTKALVKLAGKARYKYMLTGTPVLNSPMDLFSQFLFLDGGSTFGDNFYKFRMMFFYDKNGNMPKHIHFPKWVIRDGALNMISEVIASRSMSVKKEECLDLPPMVYQTYEVELSAEQRKHYNEMKNEFITYVKGEACVATLAITKALRLQQIVSGHITVTDEGGENKVHQLKETPREEALKELLEDLTPHHKVLVWAVFKDNYLQIKRVCDSLKIKYVEVHGEITAKNKELAVIEFQNNPEIRVYIGHPSSGGIGVTLTASSYSIFYSRNFSLEQSLQAEGRNHRGGSEIHEKITRIDLAAKDTIDELVLSKLRDKKDLSDSLIFELANKLSDG